MDEKLDYYSSEEMLRRASSQLMLTHNSYSDLLEKKPSKILLQSKNYHLHLIENQDDSPDRIVLPSTKMDRLAFYRQYMTSVLRTQQLIMQTSNVNLLFWNNVFNVIFVSLPHTYVSMFLASYTPEHHLFVPKMVPLFWGFKLASVIASFIEINVYITNIILTFSYIIDGITLQNPWNRCSSSQNKIPETCYELKDFVAKITNESWTFVGRFYQNDLGENFQLAQVKYFKWVVMHMPLTKRIIYVTLIMTLLILIYKFLNKRSFWKEIGESSKVKPARAATLRSFFSQRGTSGYTTQRDLTRGGEYYVELRVYNSREAECQPSEERWKRALVTLKLCTDTQTPVWRALSTLVEAGKNEFKAIQPIMYPMKLH